MSESKYTEQVDSNECICPYCKSSYQVESEDYSTGARVETCEECGMKFALEQDYEVTHTTTPNCELNDADHDWQPRPLATAHLVMVAGVAIREHDFCAVCDKCKPFTSGDMK